MKYGLWIGKYCTTKHHKQKAKPKKQVVKKAKKVPKKPAKPQKKIVKKLKEREIKTDPEL